MVNTFVRMFSVIAVAGVLVASAGAASLVQPENKPGSRGQGGPGGPGGPASVEGAMKGMNRSLRQLKGMIGDDTKKDDVLRLVGDMQRSCLAAKGMPVPGSVLRNAKDDAAKAHLGQEYRHELIQLMRTLLDLEEDVANGKTDSAKSRLAELVKQRDHAHSEMGIKDEKEEGSGGRGGEQPKEDKPAGKN